MEDMKKEREIMQMVQDLDLSGDELERSEVPRGMYDPPRSMHPMGQVIVSPPPPPSATIIANGRARR